MNASVVSFLNQCGLIVNLFGPTAVGKGWLGKLLMMCHNFTGKWGKSPIRVVVIAIGDLIRTRLDTDAEFKNTHGENLAKGRLLPDEVVYRLLEEKILEIMPTTDPTGIVLILDGFGRNGKQVAWGAKNGVFGQNTITVILNAVRSTCLDRFCHRMANQAPRTDNDIRIFHHRYNLHDQSHGPVISSLRKAGMRIFQVNADCPLEEIPENVYPNVVSLVLAYAPRGVHCEQSHVHTNNPLGVQQPPAVHPSAVTGSIPSRADVRRI